MSTFAPLSEEHARMLEGLVLRAEMGENTGLPSTKPVDAGEDEMDLDEDDEMLHNDKVELQKQDLNLSSDEDLEAQYGVAMKRSKGQTGQKDKVAKKPKSGRPGVTREEFMKRTTKTTPHRSMTTRRTPATQCPGTIPVPPPPPPVANLIEEESIVTTNIQYSEQSHGIVTIEIDTNANYTGVEVQKLIDFLVSSSSADCKKTSTRLTTIKSEVNFKVLAEPINFEPSTSEFCERKGQSGPLEHKTENFPPNRNDDQHSCLQQKGQHKETQQPELFNECHMRDLDTPNVLWNQLNLGIIVNNRGKMIKISQRTKNIRYDLITRIWKRYTQIKTVEDLFRAVLINLGHDRLADPSSWTML